MENINLEERGQYSSFGFEVYARGMFGNILPTVTTDPNKLEQQAKDTMSVRGYSYIAGGAGERATMDANRLAFRQWRLIPRMLRDTGTRDLRVELFGQTYDSPLLVAPLGVQKIFHDDGELGMAAVAAELKLPYIMSTASTATIEDVGKASGDGPRWYQLYWPSTDSITISILNRAHKAGFTVLVVTLDTFTLAWRPWDLDLGYLPFAKGVGNQVGLSDPEFQRLFAENTDGGKIQDNLLGASIMWQEDAFPGGGHTWEKIKVLRDNWPGAIVLKGIQHVDDARLAAEAGVQGIIVSNHGGRQVDGAIGSLDVLPEIVDAVGDEITVLFDSGIRTGVDVLKALCLGAKGVLIGRPWAYGLGIGGAEGAKQVLRGILADVDQSMCLAGIKTIADCNRNMVRKVVYPGDRHSSN